MALADLQMDLFKSHAKTKANHHCLKCGKRKFESGKNAGGLIRINAWMMNFQLLLIALSLFSCKNNTSKDQPAILADHKTELTKKINIDSSGDPVTYPPCNEEEIPHYTAYRISSAPKIDGQLNEEIWQNVPKSTRFRDLISGAETIHDTRAAVVWDEEFLYVAYWIEEPDLQATLTERDAPIYQDNDVELFIAGKDAYYEFEINSYGTIYEVFFIWEDSYKSGGYDKIPEFSPDQKGRRPFHGVGYKPHPRGPRIGYWNWDFPGLKSAVYCDGTMNYDKDRDRGWTVEIALPWSGMKALTLGDHRSLPPRDQDTWRMDFSRFNQYKEAPPANDSGGWAWSPHGVWDSHVPECFTYIHFSSQYVDISK